MLIKKILVIFFISVIIPNLYAEDIVTDIATDIANHHERLFISEDKRSHPNPQARMGEGALALQGILETASENDLYRNGIMTLLHKWVKPDVCVRLVRVAAGVVLKSHLAAIFENDRCTT